MDLGHWDKWILDEIQKLQERIFGERISHLYHQRSGEYELLKFCCGVTALEPDLDQCGLPGDDALEEVKTVIP